MGIRNSSLAAGALALVGLGLFAGSVIGGDGSVATVDRLGPLPGSEEAVVQVARGDSGATAAGKRSQKPSVRHGFGQPIDIAPGESSAISLKCPKKFPVPLSGGLDVSDSGVVVNAILRDSRKRAMLVIATNTSEAAAQWTAASVCAKGVKEA